MPTSAAGLEFYVLYHTIRIKGLANILLQW